MDYFICMTNSAAIKKPAAIDYAQITNAHLASGHPKKAVECLMQAIIHYSANDKFQQMFIQLVEGQTLSGRPVILRQVLEICLSNKNLTRKSLLAPWFGIIAREDDFQVLQRIADFSTYKEFKEKASGLEISPVLKDSLLIKGLPILILFNARLEKAFTFLRRYLLENPAIAIANIDFVSALALHCFQNEYVFLVDAHEEELCAELKKSIYSCDLDSQDGMALIAMYGCYDSLSGL